MNSPTTSNGSPKFILNSQPLSSRFTIGSRPSSPECILGYTGDRFRNTDDDVRRTSIVPIAGYTGHYRGKIEGKCGRSEYHRHPISMWEEDGPEETESGSFSPGAFNPTKSSDESITSRSCSPSLSTKKFIPGYTGASYKAEPKIDPPRVLMPIIGYQGDFKGKISGKLGRCDRHKHPLSHWDNETTYDIIGENKFHMRKSSKTQLVVKK